MRALFLCLSALALPSPTIAQDSERALLIVDPGNAQSMYVANYYMASRDIPAGNVIYMDPWATNYAEMAAVNLPGFLGALANTGLLDTVDFVILPPGDEFFVPASGYINDNCSAVNRFALPSAYTLARQSDKILNGLLVNDANHFSKSIWGGIAFRSATSYRFGDQSSHPDAERYFLGAMLGWTGQNGNTLTEVLDMIDRSVAVDGTHPVGTVYYMQTTDNARSGPRHGAYPTAVTKMLAAGGQAQHLMADLPLGNHDCMGVMTGRATLPIQDPAFTLLAGSFADHLTSFAGTFTTSSQTKMSEWITKGASGTAGTVEEPCNYSGKFPHARMHVSYFKGVTLGEAWFRSNAFKPFQELLLGDPLTRPYGNFPIVDVPSPPLGPVSGLVQITPVATATTPGAGIAKLDLLVDGVALQTIPDGQSFLLDTTLLADGWHDLRVTATDDKPQKAVGRWIGTLEVDNAGRTLFLGATTTVGDLGTLFDQTYVAAGGTLVEVVLLHNERVLASSTAPAGNLAVYGQNLGAGKVQVQALARFTDGPDVRSAPVDLDIAFAGGGLGAAAPTAFDFHELVRDDVAFLLELPAVFDDDPAGMTYQVLSGPAQAGLLGGQGAWRVYQPVPGATGSDSLTYTATNAAGTSNTGTISIGYYDPDPCPGPIPYCVGPPNSAGAGAVMGSQGSLSIAANNLVLTVGACPANQFGLFFYGLGQTQNPLGDGFMCVASNHVRFAVSKTDALGAASLPVDYTNPPQVSGQITVGATWNFQFWYRDPGFGSSGFNLSNAIEATFCP